MYHPLREFGLRLDLQEVPELGGAGRPESSGRATVLCSWAGYVCATNMVKEKGKPQGQFDPLSWWVSVAKLGWNVWDLDGLKARHWSHQDGILPFSKIARSKPKVVALCSNCRTFGSPKDRVLKVDVWRLLFCNFEIAGVVFGSNQIDPVTFS